MINGLTLEMVDECVDLYMGTYSLPPWNESWSSRDVVVDFYKAHLGNNYFRGYVAVTDSKIVGVSVGFLKPWIKGMEYYIDDFFISAACQRQGLGSKFMELIKGELLAENIHAIMLNTERDFPAFKFYENLGFKAAEDLTILYASF